MVVDRKQRRQSLGFSLLEVLLAISIFALSVPAVGYLYGLAFREEAETTDMTQATFLAQALVQEISQRRFKESVAAPGNGPDTGEISGISRALFDDIDDYNAYAKNSAFHTAWGAISPPVDENGSALTDFAKFSQYVDVINIADITLGPSTRSDYTLKADGSTQFKLVTVKISWNAGKRDVTYHKIFGSH